MVFLQGCSNRLGPPSCKSLPGCIVEHSKTLMGIHVTVLDWRLELRARGGAVQGMAGDGNGDWGVPGMGMILFAITSTEFRELRLFLNLHDLSIIAVP